MGAVTVFPARPKSYRRKICGISTKNFCQVREITGVKRSASGKLPTFSLKSQKNPAVEKRQHNTKTGKSSGLYAPAYASPRPRLGKTEKGKIAVENHDFSTLSTDFSTKVFHRGFPQNLCILVYISVFDKLSQNAHFFDSTKYSQVEKNREKKRT